MREREEGRRRRESRGGGRGRGRDEIGELGRGATSPTGSSPWGLVAMPGGGEGETGAETRPSTRSRRACGKSRPQALAVRTWSRVELVTHRSAAADDTTSAPAALRSSATYWISSGEIARTSAISYSCRSIAAFSL